VGNPAIHIFSLEFLQRITGGETESLPYHLARKKVPYWDTRKDVAVEPAKENALKFERFIFDVLPVAHRWVVVATSRREEFFPLKNATGADSPDVVKRAMSDLATDWLRRAGADVASGAVVEISPLTALEPADVSRFVKPGVRIESSKYFG
jgi:UDP-N-acetylglucosamine/UDP-N-acetylgalactosamine diphosphorylase